jgi:hypothetical protein
VAIETRKVWKLGCRQLRAHDVVLLRCIHVHVRAVTQARDVPPIRDHALPVQVARHQLEVVAGRAHGDCERACPAAGDESNLERLLGGQLVGALAGLLALERDDARSGPTLHPPTGRPPAHCTFSNVTAAL